MKKILMLVVSIVLVASLFLTGCTDAEDERENELIDTLKETSTSLSETFADTSADMNFELVKDYLEAWASNNDIKVTKAGKHSIILTNKATKGCSAIESVAFHVAVDTNNIEEAKSLLSTGLTALLGSEKHGKLCMIVTETNDDDFVGASTIASKYLGVDNLISLTNSKKETLKTFGSYTMNAQMSKPLEYEEPTYKNAYEITCNVENYKDAFDYANKYPNPIDMISSLLANCQSSGHLFQLSDFSCQLSDCNTPISAKAVVVIDDNNVERITKKFDKSYESMSKKCDKISAEFEYTMTEGEMPEKVLTPESASSVISMIYTLDTGIFYQDEDSGDIIAANSIFDVNTKDDEFILNLTCRSTTTESLDDMSQALRITSGLTEFNYSNGDIGVTWQSKPELADYFIESMELDSDKNLSSLLTTDLNYLTLKNPDLKCIIYGFSDDDADTVLFRLIHFSEHLAGVEVEE